MNEDNSAHTLLLSMQRACRLMGRVVVICSRCFIIDQEFSRSWTVILGKANLSLLSGPCFQSEGTLELRDV